MAKSINENALTSEIRQAVINNKANACPMVVRVAWHASGTFDKHSQSGGSNGATTRFEPESTDPANAGLSIVRDLLHPIAARHPELSQADLWTIAGCKAVEFLGGPKVPHRLGRTDAPDNGSCPPNGRLPDASQGAEHLREVFYRMGMNDQEIVALSGAHTLGRCHLVRSGYDGRWTSNPLTFDNSYFRNLVDLKWHEKKWDGPKQFEAVDGQGETLMMLPTDIALTTDPQLRKHVQRYAADKDAFFTEFSAAFSKLLALGCPAQCDPTKQSAVSTASNDKDSDEFREWAMHGSLEHVQKLAKTADVHAVEASSGRSALHKAAFWGHHHLMGYLLSTSKIAPDAQDYNGDTALHDAARFGHVEVVRALLQAGASTCIKNKEGCDPAAVAVDYGSGKFGIEKRRFEEVVRMCQTRQQSKL